MRRPYLAEYYADLVARMRRRVPDAAIGADVMVGFPTETDEDHGRVLNLRVGRAYESALQVLKQTQRSQAEQERYATAIARNSVEKGLSPAVVSAIVVVESSGNPLTVSPSGDLGLMQVNARIHAREFDFEKRNLLNPEENIDVGTSILKVMRLPP